MWVSKHNELIGSTGVRVLEERARVEYLVTMQVIFLLEDPE